MTETDELIAALHACRTERDQLALVLREAQSLRPKLLALYGSVPECVLDFCNEARGLLAEKYGAV